MCTRPKSARFWRWQVLTWSATCYGYAYDGYSYLRLSASTGSAACCKCVVCCAPGLGLGLGLGGGLGGGLGLGLRRVLRAEGRRVEG